MSGDRLAEIEARATEVQEWLAANERGDFNICCQRCNAPFEHEGHAVAAPPEWYGGLDWEAGLARDVLALVEIAKVAGPMADLPYPLSTYERGEWLLNQQILKDALARLDSGAAEEDA